LIVERLEQRSLLAIDLDFAIPLGGSGEDMGQAVTTDPVGNVIAVGRFIGTIDFDPGPGTYSLTATGGMAVYFAKYSPSGALLWAGATGGGSADGGSVAADAAGNVFVGGAFAGPTDFDPGSGIETLTHTGVGDAFILKLDPYGNFVWVKQITGGRFKTVNALDTDEAGNVHVGGRYDGTVDLDPGSGTEFVSGGSESFSQAFVVKLDSAGDFQWGGAFTGADGSYAQVHGLAVDAQGNVLTTGHIQNEIDFDPGPGVQLLASIDPLTDAFVSKLDADGNFLWVRRLGGTGYDFGFDVAVDAEGSAYAGGVFSGTVDFDPGVPSYPLTSVGDYDGYFVKLSAPGDFVSAQQIGGAGQDTVHGIVLNESGSLYATGYFNGTADFDPGAGVFNLTSAGARDVYVLKLNPDSAFSFAARVGGPGDESPVRSRSIALDPAGDIVLTGHFSEVADFDPGSSVHNLTSFGGFDGFVAKYRQQKIPVAVNIQPESLNVDSNGTLTVFIYGASDFDTSQIDVGSVQLAGATAWHSAFVDENNDGLLDLQLKFRTQDTILQQIYAELLEDDLDADNILDSTRQTAEIAVTGRTLDDQVFSGSDSISLSLAGRNLRQLLDSLFG
jgi:hypothetical protein